MISISSSRNCARCSRWTPPSGSRIGEVTDQTKVFQKEMQGLQKDLNGFATSATQMGTALTASITLPLVGVSVAATKFAMDFESAITANEDVMVSLEGLVLMMEGLAKAALLTKEDMDLFGKDALTAFDTLIARGVPMNQALLLMQPTLQALWEAQQKFGAFTDEATQALIDQALQMGLIGADQKGIFEQIHDVLLDMVDAINRLPEAFQTSMLAARGFGDELERLSRIPPPGTEYAIDPVTGQPRVAVPRGGEPTGGGSAPAPGVPTGGGAGSTPVPTTPGGAVPRGSTPVPTTPGATPTMPFTPGGVPAGGIYIAEVCISIGCSGNAAYDGEAAAMAFLRKLEQGGDIASLYRRVHHQLVDHCECP